MSYEIKRRSSRHKRTNSKSSRRKCIVLTISQDFNGPNGIRAARKLVSFTSSASPPIYMDLRDCNIGSDEDVAIVIKSI